MHLFVGPRYDTGTSSSITIELVQISANCSLKSCILPPLGASWQTHIAGVEIHDRVWESIYILWRGLTRICELLQIDSGDLIDGFTQIFAKMNSQILLEFLPLHGQYTYALK